MKKLSLRIAMGCSLVIPCLVGVMAITTAQSSAQDYYTTQVKRCTTCNNVVPDSSKKGDVCPHCFIRWGDYYPCLKVTRTWKSPSKEFKSCEGCGKDVADASKPGEPCPHCKKRWGRLNEVFIYAPTASLDVTRTQINPSREDLSKSCGACKKPVSLNAKSDDFCPHCQIKWISVNSIRIPLTPSTTPDPPPTKAPDPPKYTGFLGMPGAPQTHPSRPIRPTRPSRKSDSQPPVLLAPAQSPPTAESGIFRQSTDGTLEKVTP